MGCLANFSKNVLWPYMVLNTNQFHSSLKLIGKFIHHYLISYLLDFISLYSFQSYLVRIQSFDFKSNAYNHVPNFVRYFLCLKFRTVMKVYRLKNTRNRKTVSSQKVLMIKAIPHHQHLCVVFLIKDLAFAQF